MGDHGDGQEPGPANVYAAVASKLDKKYTARGIHIYYCDQVYAPANGDFDKYLASKGYPASEHGGVPDTSEMLYLGGGAWVRKDLIARAVGDPMLPRPETRPQGKACEQWHRRRWAPVKR